MHKGSEPKIYKSSFGWTFNSTGKKCRGESCTTCHPEPEIWDGTRSEWMGLTSFKMLQANMSNNQIFTSSYGSVWYGLDVFWYSDVSKQHIQFLGDPSDLGKASAQPVTTLHRIAVQRSVAWWGKGIHPRNGEKRGSYIEVVTKFQSSKREGERAYISYILYTVCKRV